MAEPVKPSRHRRRRTRRRKQSPNITYGQRLHVHKSDVRARLVRAKNVETFDSELPAGGAPAVSRSSAISRAGTTPCKDNPKCVAAVNLNDPFFQHRDINFILDLDAKEMFDEAVNYVTVNVRKKRSDRPPFDDRVTIDAKHLKEKGITATVTYARGEDKQPRRLRISGAVEPARRTASFRPRTRAGRRAAGKA